MFLEKKLLTAPIKKPSSTINIKDGFFKLFIPIKSFGH